MKQVLQELGSGRTLVADVPEPAAVIGALRIRTRCSLISAGTERMLVQFGRSGWVERARQQPERVRQVLDKARTDGVVATLEAVRGKLDQAIPLGYCNVGVVETAARGYAPGERVVSNGSHAETVSVPVNLCARVPDEVSDETAAFTVLGAIALQGVRLAAPTLGESFVVTGLGLIGLMTVQLLRANGCRVLGIDPDPAKTALARSFGARTVELGAAQSPLAVAADFAGAHGVDAVIIAASTDSDEPVAQAAQMCRRRGRIVLVGVTGLHLNRADFYEKELTFQVSCSYGPGRYDAAYEQGGNDYPVGYVRWTEQRNFEAVLELMSSGRLDVQRLVSHRFALEDAPAAYDLLASDAPQLGLLLEYPRRAASEAAVTSIPLAPAPAAAPSDPVVALVGAGNYAGRVLLPAMRGAGALLLGIASSRGVTAAHLGRKFGFSEVTTNADKLIADPRVNTVVVATRHDSHARFVLQGLAAGKHVFVEKPLALTMAELDEIEAIWSRLPGPQRPLLMVGFNRRFAPQVVRMRELLQGAPGAKSVVLTVNAGPVPPEHWTRDVAVGGGRIIGEGCHFIDLLRFLVGSPIARWHLSGVASASQDEVAVSFEFTDGSVGTLHYLSSGHSSYPKERVEVFCAGRVLQLDNYRVLRGYGWRGFSRVNLWRQDKGQRACMVAFLNAVRSGLRSPIPLDELLEVSRVTVAVGEAARR